MWIRNIKTGENLNLKNCIHFYDSKYKKGPGYVYEVTFEWVEEKIILTFDSEMEQQNFLEQLNPALKFVDIDPTKKPIRL